MNTRICRGCLKEKPVSAFYTVSRDPTKQRARCKECLRNEHRKTRIWSRRVGTPPKGQKYARSICIKGLNKRDYTGYCEICGVVRDKNLNYHHWDDANPSKGLWVCQHCHWILDGIDSGEILRCQAIYIIKRQQVEKEFEVDLPLETEE